MILLVYILTAVETQYVLILMLREMIEAVECGLFSSL